jgi:hypothetical protein
MNTFGRLRLSMWIITHRDSHGREQGKRVTLQTRHCEHDNVAKYVAEFKALNPVLVKSVYIESEFTSIEVNKL